MPKGAEAAGAREPCAAGASTRAAGRREQVARPDGPVSEGSAGPVRSSSPNSRRVSGDGPGGEGVGVVVAEHPPAPGQDVFLQPAGPVLLTQLAQGGGQVALGHQGSRGGRRRAPAGTGPGCLPAVAGPAAARPTHRYGRSPPRRRRAPSRHTETTPAEACLIRTSTPLGGLPRKGRACPAKAAASRLAISRQATSPVMIHPMSLTSCHQRSCRGSAEFDRPGTGPAPSSRVSIGGQRRSVTDGAHKNVELEVGLCRRRAR